MVHVYSTSLLTMEVSWAIASSTRKISDVPPCALSGRPPPLPPQRAARSLTILPACAPFSTACLPQTTRMDALPSLVVEKAQTISENFSRTRSPIVRSASIFAPVIATDATRTPPTIWEFSSTLPSCASASLPSAPSSLRRSSFISPFSASTRAGSSAGLALTAAAACSSSASCSLK